MPGEVRPLVDEINALLERSRQHTYAAEPFHRRRCAPAQDPRGGAAGAARARYARSRIPARIRDSLVKSTAGLSGSRASCRSCSRLPATSPRRCATSNMAAVDLNALAFEHASEWVTRSAEERHRPRLRRQRTRPVIVKGDAPRLGELLDNLLDNAVRYTPEGGRVTVRVAASPSRRWA